MDSRVKNLWIERVIYEELYFQGIKKVFQRVFGTSKKNGKTNNQETKSSGDSDNSASKDPSINWSKESSDIESKFNMCECDQIQAANF